MDASSTAKSEVSSAHTSGDSRSQSSRTQADRTEGRSNRLTGSRTLERLIPSSTDFEDIVAYEDLPPWRSEPQRSEPQRSEPQRPGADSARDSKQRLQPDAAPSQNNGHHGSSANAPLNVDIPIGSVKRAFELPTPTAGPLLARSANVSRTIRVGLVVAIAVSSTALIGLKLLDKRSAYPGFTPSAGAVAVEDLVRHASKVAGVTHVKGSYVPGVGAVLSVTAHDINIDEAPAWWSSGVAPLAPRFAPGGNEDLVVVLEALGGRSFTRTFVAPLAKLDEAGEYKLYSSTADLPNDSPSVSGPDALALLVPESSVPEPQKPVQIPTQDALQNPAELTATSDNSTIQPAIQPVTPSTTRATKSLEQDSTDTIAKEANPRGNPSEGASRPTPTIVRANTNPSTSKEGATASLPNIPNGKVVAAAPVDMAATTGTESFDKRSMNWTPLSGQWKFADGTYQQLDNSGFDFISQFHATPQPNFTVSCKLSALSGELNAGLILFQKKLGSRANATVIDITEKGSYVRWGHYDRGGVYIFDGGAKLEAPIDPKKGVVLKAVTKSGTVAVFLDGKSLGEFTPFSVDGSVGLVSSLAQVAFDDFVLAAA
jgi:hypothetical protein